VEAAVTKTWHFNTILALALIFMAVCLRLLSHPANFAPIAAVAIFGGAVLPRKFAVWVPLAAMMLSDAIIGFYPMMPITWGCYVLVAFTSSTWLKKPTFIRTAMLTISSSIFFYAVTNFAVWVTSGMYAHTWSGLAQCYFLALPFWRNTAASDIFYTSALFGTFALGKYAASWPIKIMQVRGYHD
jgi:hypothetical protein